MAELAGLALWNRLEETDPAATKRFDNGSFKGTAVDAVYNIKRVTEQLGPVGFAWGWHIVSERLDRFGTDQNEQVVHTAVVRAWFRQSDGSVREVEQIGQTIAARWTGRDSANRRFMIDAEHGKKSVTDALSKIMLSLGASADVWMGRFDGTKYAELSKGFADREEPVAEKPEPTPPADMIIAAAERALAKLPAMDLGKLESVRAWLKQAPGEDSLTHWQLLGQRDKGLRDRLLAALGERAKALETPAPAPRDETPEEAVRRANADQERRRNPNANVPLYSDREQELLRAANEWIEYLEQADRAGVQAAELWLEESEPGSKVNRYDDLGAFADRARNKLVLSIEGARERLGVRRGAAE